MNQPQNIPIFDTLIQYGSLKRKIVAILVGCPAPLEVEITKQAFFVTPTTQVRDCPPMKKIKIQHNTHILTERSGR